MLSPGLARACKHSNLVEAVELVTELADTSLSREHLVILAFRVKLIQQEELLSIFSGSLSHKAVDQKCILLGLRCPALVDNPHYLPVSVLSLLLSRVHQLERVVVLHSETHKVFFDLVTNFLCVWNVLVGLIASVHAGIVGFASDEH